MTHKAKYLVASVLVPAVLSLSLAAGFEIDWSTIDGGGEMSSTGGGYELSGTIGQPDAGTVAMTGGDFSLKGGFWTGLPCLLNIPADYDNDCDVDTGDFALFQACVSGPDVPYAVDCDDRDFDSDNDADQRDFAYFQRCLSGEGVPADPNCAD